jgi:topoisomerase-4 subunit A
LRLNYDGRGKLLGEFQSDDKILVVESNGDCYTTNFDVNNHYEPYMLVIEKYDPSKVWTAVLFDQDQNGYPYLKRFNMDANARKQNFLGENKENKLLVLTCQAYPRILVTFGGADHFREPLEIDAEQFITVKSSKARGKRVSTWEVDRIEELEPTRFPEVKTEEEVPDTEEEVNEDPDEGKSDQDIRDELTGQLSLF